MVDIFRRSEFIDVAIRAAVALTEQKSASGNLAANVAQPP
jgi:hypothetical protein